jgi:predicted nucleotidyltransferase
VAGAFARDLLLMHVHGFNHSRATRDIDIGIAVRAWTDFERVRNELVRTGKFSVVRDIAHRLRFRESRDSPGIPLDVVPFGGVEDRQGMLHWPPGRTEVMSVAGFDEALKGAEEVRITHELSIRVASLPGQTLLKLAAWLDRRDQTPRDAQDLFFLFRRYGDAGNEDRLYGEKAALFEASGFDIELAGAALLGEDVRQIALPANYQRLTTSFASPELRDRFLTHVSSGTALPEEDRAERAQTIIDAFFSGFRLPRMG